MEPLFKRVPTAIVDNLFDVLTISVAGYAFIRNIFQPYSAQDLPTLLTLAVSCLGLLGVSGVWVRRRELGALRDQTASVQRIVEGLAAGRARASQFLTEDAPLVASDIARAREICIVGMTLGRTSRELVQPLSDAIGRGARIRVMFLDHEVSALMDEAALRSSGNTTAEWWTQRLATVRTLFRVVAEAQGPGSIDCRALPFIPSFGMICLDPHEDTAVCSIEIYHHRSAGKNATFFLSAAYDREWYEYFAKQLNILWECGRPVDLLR